MSDRTEAQAAFALRVVADLVSALVLTGALPKKHATLLISDSLNEILTAEPDLAPQLREIAATMTAQVELTYADLQHRLRREGLDDE